MRPLQTFVKRPSVGAAYMRPGFSHVHSMRRASGKRGRRGGMEWPIRRGGMEINQNEDGGLPLRPWRISPNMDRWFLNPD